MGEYADSLKKTNKRTDASEAVTAAREAAAKAAAEAKRRADAAKAQEKRDATRSAGRNSTNPPAPPKVNPPPPPPPVVKPPPVVTPPPTVNPGTTPSTPTPTPQSSVTAVSVLDPNIYTAYKKEIARLTLKLVNRAKNLLLAYDFSSIDRIAEYQIEADNGARNTDVISIPQVPQSPSTSVLTAQDTAVALINEISNKISDNVPLATKLDLFGSDVNGRFTPRKVGISNGISNYDLRFVVNNVSPEIKNIIIRCYEIS
jgi:hypothetical protein